MSTKPIGRPTIYTEELADEICVAISVSGKGLDHICAENEGFPCAKTIYLWALKYPSFLQKYMKARRFQTHVLMDRIISVADDDDNDNLIKINRARVKIDAFKITAARVNADTYGDKKEISHSLDEETARKVRDIDSKYNY